MADYADRSVNTAFAGLASTCAIMGGVGLACLTGYEVLRQMKRLPAKKLTSCKDTNRGSDTTTAEDWEMGHLYHARVFHARTPSPPIARWPLAWTWQVLKFNDWWYATHTGMDNVVYVRFLRIAVYWVLLHTVTTAPILLAIDLKFSKGVEASDMSKASLAYLVSTPIAGCTPADSAACLTPNLQGRSLLWIQLCMIWWITFTWFGALVWLGKGSLTVRKKLIEHTRQETLATQQIQQQQRNKQADEQSDSPGEYQLTEFGTHEKHHRKTPGQSRPGPEEAGAHLSESLDTNNVGWRKRTLLVTNLPATLRDEISVRKYFEEYLRPDDATVSDGGRLQGADASTDQMIAGDEHGTGLFEDVDVACPPESPVQAVVLVRKMGELSAMLNRRQEILQQLEAAHIKLAQTVLGRVRQQVARKEGRAVEEEAPSAGQRFRAMFRSRGQSQGKKATDAKPSADVETKGAKTVDRELMERLGKYIAEDADFGDAEAASVWEALSQIPRPLLDAYQPVTRLSALFRGQRVPTIDYLLTKLNLLTALITEMKSRPPTAYEPTSTAFVTLKDPRQARMVWRELKSQIVIKVRMAPEVKDLDWDRLMRTSFTGDLFRGFGVNAFFWGFTVFWIIPINAISTALFSVKNLEKVIPGLATFFESHEQLEDFISLTLPSLIVSIITMCVPEIIFQISKRAQGFLTFSSLYDQCLCRYWKFIICNIIIFFTIGTTTVESILNTIGGSTSKDDILDSVANAFPTAAPFFVSYLILTLALHSGFELLGFMIPIIVHFLGVNKAVTPRARAVKTFPRNFNRYYWLPFHMLILTIIFIFGILNPLVIPFALVYMFVAMIVFKRSFAFVYYRRFMEKDGAIYYTRILRFTLDGLTTGQVVVLIFFAVTNQSKAYIALTAVLIPLTVLFKILGTQLWKSQCRAIDDWESNVICGIEADAAREQTGRYPEINRIPEPESKFVRTWQRIHDSMHANGTEKPSWLAMRSARGKSDNPAVVGAALVASAPMKVAKKAKHDGSKITQVAKISVGLDKAMKAQVAQDKMTHAQWDEDQSKTVASRATLGSRAYRGEHQGGGVQRAVSGSSMMRKRSVRQPTDDKGRIRRASTGVVDEEKAQARQDPESSPSDTPNHTSPSSEYSRDGAGEEDEDEDGEGYEEEWPLLQSHPPVRWDDTPDNEARYDNPFYGSELDPFLWLPRNPLKPLNLCDTIEWYGNAFVSSDGGSGIIGEWDEDDDFAPGPAVDGDVSLVIGDDGVSVGGLTSGGATLASRIGMISGREEIAINSILAERLAEHDEEEVQAAEKHDISASVPKNLMNEYREAIQLDEDDEAGEELDSVAGLQGGETLFQPTSGRSVSASGSPLQEQQPSLPSPTHLRAHFAPDPDHPPRTASTIISHSVSGGSLSRPGGGVYRQPSRVGAPRDRRSSAGYSHDQGHSQGVDGGSVIMGGGASIISTTSVGKSISMRQALHAEVLEEERRRTIRDRLSSATRKERREMSQKRVKRAVSSSSASTRQPSTTRPSSGMRTASAATTVKNETRRGWTTAANHPSRTNSIEATMESGTASRLDDSSSPPKGAHPNTLAPPLSPSAIHPRSSSVRRPRSQGKETRERAPSTSTVIVHEADYAAPAGGVGASAGVEGEGGEGEAVEMKELGGGQRNVQ